MIGCEINWPEAFMWVGIAFAVAWMARKVL